jgi:thiol-disulfide isomerase/thioredoxin
MKNLYLTLITLLAFNFASAQSLESIVKENEGKVVLVDFWASWCKPCRKEMKHVAKLHEKYKDVVFVYISMDIEKDKWEAAAEKEGIKDEKYSYMSATIRKSPNLPPLNVTAIPRYILFDKEGKLVNMDAPRPSDGKKLAKEIEKYL